MRTLLFILFALLQFSFGKPMVKEVKWLVERNSKLIIDGRSNVNKFRCQIDQYYGLDTLSVRYDPYTSKIVSLTGSIQVEAENFDCRNDMMTADLRKTIMADKYPHLKVDFLPIHKPVKNYGHMPTKAVIQISLGGVCKEFELHYKIATSDNGATTLVGSRKFLFSDFNLEPPTKMLGMVKVENEFEVIFDLVLKPLV
jgi:hypothetical protein